ncbi:MAG TPA: xanthine dehydrogenase molybdopterin binding subunit, partial [Burkholderiaceae bacterium]|nr:xanthine dehydrogenase molybdopterin binding subunit [Burkholderiaceae bacterium]
MNKLVDAPLANTALATPQVGIARPHESAELHVTGRAAYADDIAEVAGTLHCALGLSPVAHGRLLSLDIDRLRREPGVVEVLTATDIPGLNDCGPIVHDDPILADGILHYLGQPVFAVIAGSRQTARRVAALAKEVIRCEPLPALLTAREAHAAGRYVLPPMHLTRGDPETALEKAPHRLQGRF